MKKIELLQRLESVKARSAWRKGVVNYAIDLLDGLDTDVEFEYRTVEEDLLNGASNWHEYSWGGCSYIYDEDIANALCTPSELKRTDNGRKSPNAHEQWLDVQARALAQACELIKRLIKVSDC